jgi:hypothetical protein
LLPSRTYHWPVIARGLGSVPALAVVATLLLSGCSGDLPADEAHKAAGAPRSAPPSTPSTPLASSAPPATATPSAPSAPSPSALPPSTVPTPTDKPDGPTRRVESNGFTFEVPRGWLELDAGEITDGAADRPEIKELADRLGISPEQLVSTMAQVDLFLFSDEGGRAGTVDNLNVIGGPVAQLNESQLQLGLLTAGAEHLETLHVSSAVGDVLRVSYDLTLGARTVHAVAVALQHDDSGAVVTITAHDTATAQELATLVVDTVKSADPTIG